jgi:hypothetical protein
MRKFLVVTFAAALAALTLPALAGECLDGFSCDHVCPLAREANNHRSAGAESVTKAPSLRAALAASVERNLRRI